MPITYHLPSGPKNLAPLFPSVDFKNVDEYYLQLKNGTTVLLTTNHFHRGNLYESDSVRLFFVNYLGGIDALNLRIVEGDTDVKSSTWKKGLSYPLQKYDGGLQRFNVVANTLITGDSTAYEEEDQDYLDELRTTPNAWVQWSGTQGQNDDYLPIVISDAKFVKRQSEDRFQYILQVEFTLSNEKMILRN